MAAPEPVHEPHPTEDTTLLDVLITEHRERSRRLQDARSSAQATIGGIATALVALAALVASQLDLGALDLQQRITLGVGAFAVILALVCWVDALEGPVKRHLKPQRDAAAEAAECYTISRTTFDPVGVRLALLDRLLAEEALAARELGPREDMVRAVIFAAFIAVCTLTLFGFESIW